jgi:hypothetical protein
MSVFARQGASVSKWSLPYVSLQCCLRCAYPFQTCIFLLSVTQFLLYDTHLFSLLSSSQLPSHVPSHPSISTTLVQRLRTRHPLIIVFIMFSDITHSLVFIHMPCKVSHHRLSLTRNTQSPTQNLCLADEEISYRGTRMGVDTKEGWHGRRGIGRADIVDMHIWRSAW